VALACAVCLPFVSHNHPATAAPLIGNARYIVRLKHRAAAATATATATASTAASRVDGNHPPQHAPDEEEDACEPWTVPPDERCAYVRTRPDACYPDGGTQLYIVAHYCWLGGGGGWGGGGGGGDDGSTTLAALAAATLPWLVFALTAALAFGVLITTAQRFFCPALEIVADHLRLPPAVAGATLLALGNGAPDTFTMLAVVQSEHPGAVGIVVTEPVGGGLFVTTVVLAAVVRMSRGVMARSAAAKEAAAKESQQQQQQQQQQRDGGAAALEAGEAGGGALPAVAASAAPRTPVASTSTAPLSPSVRLPIRRSTFIKDAGFLLSGVAAALLFVIDSNVTVGQACALLALYASYVAVTFAVSRGEEPVHAEAELREVPLLAEDMLGLEGESLLGDGWGAGAAGFGLRFGGRGEGSSSSWSTVSSEGALLEEGDEQDEEEEEEEEQGDADDHDGDDEEQGGGPPQRRRPLSATSAGKAPPPPPLPSALSSRPGSRLSGTGFLASASSLPAAPQGSTALEDRWVEAARAALRSARRDKEEGRVRQLLEQQEREDQVLLLARGGGGEAPGPSAISDPPLSPMRADSGGGAEQQQHPQQKSQTPPNRSGSVTPPPNAPSRLPSAPLAAANAAASVAAVAAATVAAAASSAAAASAAHPPARRNPSVVMAGPPVLLRRASRSQSAAGGGGGGGGGGMGAAAAAAVTAAAATAAANAAAAVAASEARSRAEAERLRQRVASLQGRVREVEYRLAAYEGPPPAPPPIPQPNKARRRQQQQQQQQQEQQQSPAADPAASPEWRRGLVAWASSLLCRLGLATAPPPPPASAGEDPSAALLNRGSGDGAAQQHHRRHASDGERLQPLLEDAEAGGGAAGGEGCAGALPPPPPPPPPPPVDAGGGGGGGHDDNHRHPTLGLVHSHSHGHNSHAAATQPPSLMFLIEQPFLWLLSLTMPRVGSARDHRHPLWKAALLPVTAPLTVAAAYGLLPAVGPAGLAYGAAAGLVGAACLAAVYPRDRVPREPLKGAFAAATFCMSVVWLNLSASALVGLAVAAGHILGLSPGLLGATVLSWGNSAPDLVGDVSLARDGFPTMAVAACFASPLFSLLAGMAGSLALGAARSGGTLFLPDVGGEPLVIMYGALAMGLALQLGLALWPAEWRGWWRGAEEGGGDRADAEDKDESGHPVVRLGVGATFIGLFVYAAYTTAYLLYSLGVI
jgi:Ca2+/Na+ antiporter